MTPEVRNQVQTIPAVCKRAGCGRPGSFLMPGAAAKGLGLGEATCWLCVACYRNLMWAPFMEAVSNPTPVGQYNHVGRRREYIRMPTCTPPVFKGVDQPCELEA